MKKIIDSNRAVNTVPQTGKPLSLQLKQDCKMKLDIPFIKNIDLRKQYNRFGSWIGNQTRRVEEIMGQRGRRRNRFLVLFFTAFILFDYVMYCIHIEKYPFDIFPPLPALESTVAIKVFLPSPDGKNVFEEKRIVPEFDSETKYASYLFNLVRKGSLYDNTLSAVPVELNIKEVIFHPFDESAEKTCIINIDPTIIKEGITPVKGSEDIFRLAVEKTITYNIKSVKKVYIMERGIPEKKIWDL